MMHSPWSLKILTESPVTLIAGVSGEAWLVPDDGEPLRIGPGDMAVTRAPAHYTLAETPSTPSALPTVVIHPNQPCCDLDGKSQFEKMSLGVRTWGDDPDGSTVFLVEAYESHLSDISDRLLRALPPFCRRRSSTGVGGG